MLNFTELNLFALKIFKIIPLIWLGDIAQILPSCINETQDEE